MPRSAPSPDDVASGDRQQLVASIHAENKRTYSTPDGAASLKSFLLSSDARWTYLFELLQNALDADARKVSIRIVPDGLVFQHDGSKPLEAKDVEGLSKLYRSTKRAATVGFMGIGFKSGFRRFHRVGVSGWGWKFQFEMVSRMGAHGERVPRLIGAVLPVWNDDLPSPDTGFTTRFELSVVQELAPLQDDLSPLLKHDAAVLALLAQRGLRTLELGDRTFAMDITSDGETDLARAREESRSLAWRIFSVKYRPSLDAVRRFLERRFIEDATDQEVDEAGREREVLGILPLDQDESPLPPDVGYVFATLPTESTSPFRLHVQADWFVSQSRTGLPELTTNAWQREIVQQLAPLVAAYTRWVGANARSAKEYRTFLEVLDSPQESEATLAEPLLDPEWHERLTLELRDTPFVPAWLGTSLRACCPREVLRLPGALGSAFGSKRDRRADLLFARPVLAEDAVGPRSVRLLDWIGPLPSAGPDSLRELPDRAYDEWWSSLPSDRRNETLFALWDAIEALADTTPAWRTAVRVPTEGGAWIPLAHSRYCPERPSETEELGKEVLALVEQDLPGHDVRPRGRLYEELARRGGGARFLFELRSTRVSLESACSAALSRESDSASPRLGLVVSLAHWAAHRNRFDLITHVVAEDAAGQRLVVPLMAAVLGEPYVPDATARRGIFAGLPVIVSDYLLRDPWSHPATFWNDIFKREALGPLVWAESVMQFSRWRAGDAASAAGLVTAELRPANNAGYRVVDFSFPRDVAGAAGHVAAWLEQEAAALVGYGHPHVRSDYYGPQRAMGRAPASWIQVLRELLWVPCQDGELRRPSDALAAADATRPSAPVAAVSPALIRTLRGEGLSFGEHVPAAPPEPPSPPDPAETDVASVAQVIRRIIETNADAESRAQALAALNLPHPTLGSVPWNRIARRVGANARSSLGGYVIAVDTFSEELRNVLASAGVRDHVPETTSGRQALDFLERVWKRAAAGEEKLASDVGDYLASAYDAVLTDGLSDESLSERFAGTRDRVRVFAERQWVALEGSPRPCYDDLRQPIPPSARMGVVVATWRHLGGTFESAAVVAKALALPPLSAVIDVRWADGRELDGGSVKRRFAEVLTDLQAISGGTPSEPDRVSLKRLASMTLVVGSLNVPRFFRRDGATLVTAGSPTMFAPDVAVALAAEFRIRQNEAVGYLTMVIAALEDEQSFVAARERLRDLFDLGPLPPRIPEPQEPERQDGLETSTGDAPPSASTSEEGQGLPHRKPERDDTVESGERDDANHRPEGRSVESFDQRPAEEGTRQHTGHSQPRAADRSTPEGAQDDASHQTERMRTGGAGSTGNAAGRGAPSFTMGRLAAQSRPAAPAAPFSEVTRGDQGTKDGITAEPESDVEFREAVVRYERIHGREATLLDPNHEGFDIRSAGAGETRLIEVKGRRAIWEGDEVVTVKPAQTREAARNVREAMGVSWWLYVVEALGDAKYRVHPIENPLRCGGLALRGDVWRQHSVDPSEV